MGNTESCTCYRTKLKKNENENNGEIIKQVEMDEMIDTYQLETKKDIFIEEEILNKDEGNTLEKVIEEDNEFIFLKNEDLL